jgi:hypothetical protein
MRSITRLGLVMSAGKVPGFTQLYTGNQFDFLAVNVAGPPRTSTSRVNSIVSPLTTPLYMIFTELPTEIEVLDKRDIVAVHLALRDSTVTALIGYRAFQRGAGSLEGEGSGCSGSAAARDLRRPFTADVGCGSNEGEAQYGHQGQESSFPGGKDAGWGHEVTVSGVNPRAALQTFTAR